MVRQKYNGYKSTFGRPPEPPQKGGNGKGLFICITIICVLASIGCFGLVGVSMYQERVVKIAKVAPASPPMKSTFARVGVSADMALADAYRVVTSAGFGSPFSYQGNYASVVAGKRTAGSRIIYSTMDKDGSGMELGSLEWSGTQWEIYDAGTSDNFGLLCFSGGTNADDPSDGVWTLEDDGVGSVVSVTALDPVFQTERDSEIVEYVDMGAVYNGEAIYVSTTKPSVYGYLFAAYDGSIWNIGPIPTEPGLEVYSSATSDLYGTWTLGTEGSPPAPVVTAIIPAAAPTYDSGTGASVNTAGTQITIPLTAPTGAVPATGVTGFTIKVKPGGVGEAVTRTITNAIIDSVNIPGDGYVVAGAGDSSADNVYNPVQGEATLTFVPDGVDLQNPNNGDYKMIWSVNKWELRSWFAIGSTWDQMYFGGTNPVDPTDGAWTSYGEDDAPTVTAEPGINTTDVVLTIAGKIHDNDTVTFTYSKASGNVEDDNGIEMEDISETAVTNNSTAELKTYKPIVLENGQLRQLPEGEKVETGDNSAGSINGVTVSGTPETGQIITATSETAAEWSNPPASGVSSVNTRSGDVTLNSSDVGLSNVTNDVQLKAADLDTDSAMAANSDSKIPSQKAVKTALATKANKTPIIVTPTIGSTITPSGLSDIIDIDGLDVNTTINTPSGTPSNGQKILFRIKDDGTSRDITWDTPYASSGGYTLPTATTTGVKMFLLFLYYYPDGIWELVGVA